MMTRLILCGWIAAIVMCPAIAQADCDDAAVQAYLGEYQAARLINPSKIFGSDPSPADAACYRNKVARALSKTLGPVIGYKLVAGSPNQQQTLKSPGPGWGFMVGKGTLMKSGAKVLAQIASVVHCEGDLLVEVKDAGLADARTLIEGIRHVAAISPFIEMPNRTIGDRFTMNALVSTNTTYRGGIVGPRVTAEPTQAFLDAVARMTVVMSEDETGTVLGRGIGAPPGHHADMEHPIGRAMWLARTLKAAGITVKAGDVLSLGSYAGPVVPPHGKHVTLMYAGLPGNPSVTVYFE